jgi:hypothetical protein
MPITDQDRKLANDTFKVRIASNMDLTRTALTKIFAPDALDSFSFDSNSVSKQVERLKGINDVDQLSECFLGIIDYPMGVKRIDDEHHRYLSSRYYSRLHKTNHADALFEGTSSRSYQHGFSNHSYTFGYYLSKNRDKISAPELQAILDLFYYGYITKGFHSYCEIHAAFLRASENYDYPALRSDDLLASSSLTVNLVPPHLRSHKTAFDKLLTKLQDETIGIIIEDNQALKAIAENLHKKLNHASQAFFNTPTPESLVKFKSDCMNEINLALKAFKTHLSTWEKLSPILKGILGVLALIFIVPAVVVAVSSSYTQTFFGSSPYQRLDLLRGRMDHDFPDTFPAAG